MFDYDDREGDDVRKWRKKLLLHPDPKVRENKTWYGKCKMQKNKNMASKLVIGHVHGNT